MSRVPLRGTSLALTVLCLASSAATALAATPQPASPNASVFSIGVAPGAPVINGHFGFSGAPGSTASAAVAIRNDRSTPLDVEIYAAELSQKSDGTLSPGQIDSAQDGPHLWIHPATPSLTIPGGGTVNAPFTVAIPVGTPAGDHPASVVVAADIGVSGNSIVQAREALIVEIHVNGVDQPAATLSPLTNAPSHATTGPMTFGVSVSNTGNVTLTVTGSVVLTDGNGATVASIPLEPTTTLLIPGGSFDLRSAVTTPPAGRLTARASVDLLLNGQRVRTLTSSALTLGSPESTGFPWLWLVAALAIALAIAAAVLVRRHRRRTSASRS